MNEVDLGTDTPTCASRSTLDLLHNILGRAIKVGSLYDFMAAFRMHNNLDAGIVGTRFFNLLDAKTHVRAAITLPEHNFGAFQFLLGVRGSHRIFGIPDSHLGGRYAIFEGCIAT